MAQVLVPLLEEPAADRVPDGKLGSQADFLKLFGIIRRGTSKGSKVLF